MDLAAVLIPCLNLPDDRIAPDVRFKLITWGRSEADLLPGGKVVEVDIILVIPMLFNVLTPVSPYDPIFPDCSVFLITAPGTDCQDGFSAVHIHGRGREHILIIEACGIHLFC